MDSLDEALILLAHPINLLLILVTAICLFTRNRVLTVLELDYIGPSQTYLAFGTALYISLFLFIFKRPKSEQIHP